MAQKLVFIEGENYGGVKNLETVNNELAQDGWMVQNIFPQKVASEGAHGFGGFLVILKK